MTGQLAFDLPVTTGISRDDFFASIGNSAALRAIEAWHDWPQYRMLLLGPDGAGKTHLAHIWAADARAVIIAAVDLVAADIPALAAGPVCVEDADQIATDVAAETALFHLYNLGAPLLITAKTAPRDWGLRLADLKSRVQAMATVQIAPPDDVLLSAVLIKLFADRQIAVSPNLISYLLQRMDRSIIAARNVVAALDALALARARPVTRALAAELLEQPNVR